MEQLGRGVVALPLGSGNFVSWRLLGTDDAERTTFDVIRDGEIVVTDLTKTNYRDTKGTRGASYQIVTRVDGEQTEMTSPMAAWTQAYLPLKLDRPAAGRTKPYSTTIDKESVSFPNGQEYTYSPNDCSVGDVDGDGEYELIVKWDPSNAKDNSQNGVTGIVYIDCYKIAYGETSVSPVSGNELQNCRLLWRVDLGQNIRAGAHYTQFMVYDFDGDGRAEMMCKTAPGSKDGKGNYVNQAASDAMIKAASNIKDWTSEGAGRVNGGHEYLTVFNGETGAAVHTIAYYPNRNATTTLSEAAGTYNWGGSSKNDKGDYGNRGERYLAAVAYLGGVDANPSGIFCRGYYTYAYVWAVDFDGQQLKHRWLHRSDSQTQYSVVDANMKQSSKITAPKATNGSGSNTLYGNGNHNMTVADVDGDGCDEIIWGSAAVDHDGRLLYATGFGHGDALHMGQMVAGRHGLQVFQVHEEKGTYAWDLHDAATGEILYKGGPEGKDNGRGMAAQLSNQTQDWWFSSAGDRLQRSAATGNVASTANGSVNFRMYWDGSAQDALLDGSKLTKYNDSSSKFTDLRTFTGSSCNGTKATPNLTADILGDWREELILWNTSDGCTLYLYTTTSETNYAVPTLMHDHTYRMAICWQNTAYNQPPHLGYNLAKAVAPLIVDSPVMIEASLGNYFESTVSVKRARNITLNASLLPDGTRKNFATPDGFEFSKASDNTSFTLKGTPIQDGEYKFAIRMTGLNGEAVIDTLTLSVMSSTGGVEELMAAKSTLVNTAVYDLAGHRLSDGSLKRLHKGLYMVVTETTKGRKVRKVVTE
jgi:rhamnogalacturonan endolyase